MHDVGVVRHGVEGGLVGPKMLEMIVTEQWAREEMGGAGLSGVVGEMEVGGWRTREAVKTVGRGLGSAKERQRLMLVKVVHTEA